MTTRFDSIDSNSRPVSISRKGNKHHVAKWINSAISGVLLLSSAPGAALAASEDAMPKYVVGAASSQVSQGTSPMSAAKVSQAQTSSSKPATQTQVSQATDTHASPIKLNGKATFEDSVNPFKEDGSTETIPQGTPLNLTVTTTLNSELAKEGDEIRAEVSTDLKDGTKVLLPGKWQVVGKVAHVQGQKRLGRDGYIEIKFEKLVSPDGKYVVPLDASASTKESAAKTITKQALTTTGYAGVGAIGGSLLSVQLTGLPLAISTYGLSVAGGAAIGGALGVAAALHRKGEILCAFPGDEIQIRIPAPLTIPAFNQAVVPSKAPKPTLDDLNIVVKDAQFLPFPFGDKKSRLLTMRVLVENHSKQSYSFSNFAVKCNHNHEYYPYAASPDSYKQRAKTVRPEGVQEATLTFQVGSPKLKYWLVLLDPGRTNILSQVAIN